MREVTIHSSMRTTSLRITEGHGGAQFEVTMPASRPRSDDLGSNTESIRFWVPAPEIGRLLRGLRPMEIKDGKPQ